MKRPEPPPYVVIEKNTLIKRSVVPFNLYVVESIDVARRIFRAGIGVKLKDALAQRGDALLEMSNRLKTRSLPYRELIARADGFVCLPLQEGPENVRTYAESQRLEWARDTLRFAFKANIKVYTWGLNRAPAPPCSGCSNGVARMLRLCSPGDKACDRAYEAGRWAFTTTKERR